MQWELGEQSWQTHLEARSLLPVAEPLPTEITDKWVSTGHEDTAADLINKISELQRMTGKLDPNLVGLKDPLEQVRYLKQNNDLIMLSLGAIGGFLFIFSMVRAARYIGSFSIKRKSEAASSGITANQSIYSSGSVNVPLSHYHRNANDIPLPPPLA